MRVVETLILYGILGVVVAAAMAATSPPRGLRGWTELLVRWMGWPFFAPLVLGAALDRETRPRMESSRVRGPLFRRLRAAEQGLIDSLRGLDGIAEEVLAPQLRRVQQFAASLAGVESRLLELESLLDSSEFDRERVQETLEQLEQRGFSGEDARVQSVKARLRNIERLERIRDHTHAEVERVVLKLEEMRSQVSLLRFAHRPEGELAELVRDVALEVEAVSEGVWSEV